MGQLGMGPEVSSKGLAATITDLKDVKISEVKSAYLQNAVIRVNDNDNGEIWTWGCNDATAANVLGRDGEENSPERVKGLEDKDIARISIGQYHMAALDITGNLYFWGTYKVDEFIGPYFSKHPRDFVPYPERHPDLMTTKFKNIASAGNFTVGITEAGEILEWGWTRRTERLTRKDTSRMSLIPSLVNIPPKLTIESVYCGHVHAIALTTDSKMKNKVVLSWGYNQKGQLGHDDTVTRERPVKIKALPTNVTMVACGEFHNLALTEDHKVYSWGAASSGQCGLGEDKTEVIIPTQITYFNTLPSDDYIVNVGCGSDHSLAVTKSGHVYTWGTGIQYQLCNGSCDGDIFEPALIKSKAFDSVYHCLKAVGGSSHSLFVGKKREESDTK